MRTGFEGLVALMNQVDAETERARKAGISLGGGPGRVRWTICAMLFAATSINYMDRQVIGLLKPTLQNSIGLTEVHYGYIVAAFQVAYAVGLVVAGRLVDRLGSRVGYSLFMGVWSLAGMAHALARSALGFGIARFFLGLGEAGNFPAAIKTVADWFPQSERSLATGIFNSGANVGAIIAPFQVDAPRVAPYLPRSGHTDGTTHSLVEAPHLPADLGILHCEVSHRSDLVVLSLLVAVLFRLPLSPWPFASRLAADHRLQRLGDRQHRWRMASCAVSKPASGCSQRAHVRYAHLCGPGTSHFYGGQFEFRVGRHRIA